MGKTKGLNELNERVEHGNTLSNIFKYISSVQISTEKLIKTEMFVRSDSPQFSRKKKQYFGRQIAN